MRNDFSLNLYYTAELAEPIDFADFNHKEYKLAFNIYRRQPAYRFLKKYTVFISTRHLTSAGYIVYYEDSKKAALDYARTILKKRFSMGAVPPENTAVCRGKTIQYLNLAQVS